MTRGGFKNKSSRLRFQGSKFAQENLTNSRLYTKIEYAFCIIKEITILAQFLVILYTLIQAHQFFLLQYAKKLHEY